jgi:hypothetical protein
MAARCTVCSAPKRIDLLPEPLAPCRMHLDRGTSDTPSRAVITRSTQRLDGALYRSNDIRSETGAIRKEEEQ